MHYWLVKSEPETYSFADLQKEGRTIWDGVRNFQARNNLKNMKKGDQVLFYHSVKEKAVVGIAEVSKEYFQDPRTPDPQWVAVEIIPGKAFLHPVTLEQVKNEGDLEEIPLVRHGRLSVQPLPREAYEKIVKMGAQG